MLQVQDRLLPCTKAMLPCTQAMLLYTGAMLQLIDEY